MNKLFISSKINLNIGNSISFDCRYVFSGLKPLLNLFRSFKISSQMKARNFEIPYFGGFQLSDYVPSLENYFDIGKEIACYKDIDEAELLIKYYLNNDTDRNSVRVASHKRAVREHGYKNRLKNVLDQIK
jgi:spore maturation protein CgeB